LTLTFKQNLLSQPKERRIEELVGADKLTSQLLVQAALNNV